MLFRAVQKWFSLVISKSLTNDVKLMVMIHDFGKYKLYMAMALLKNINI